MNFGPNEKILRDPDRTKQTQQFHNRENVRPTEEQEHKNSTHWVGTVNKKCQAGQPCGVVAADYLNR